MPSFFQFWFTYIFLSEIGSALFYFFIIYLLCYAAVLIKFTYYAYYDQEKELCLVYFHYLYE